MDGGVHSTTGGASSSGGSIASGGSSFTGGASMSDASACSSSEKLCGGVCVRPGPSVGCNLSSCTPCPDPPPANGVLACDGGSQECSFVCLSGFTKSGSGCVSSYGAGGTGAGDAATSCGVDGSTCPDCGPNNGPGCCVNGHCGCLMLWIPGTCH
jgi:hypothetical protein